MFVELHLEGMISLLHDLTTAWIVMVYLLAFPLETRKLDGELGNLDSIWKFSGAMLRKCAGRL
jgi:hypothetical protein